MDLVMLEPFLELFASAIRATEYVGAAVFLLFAVWCGFMEAIIITAAILRVLVKLVRTRTNHAIEAVRAIFEKKQ